MHAVKHREQRLHPLPLFNPPPQSSSFVRRGEKYKWSMMCPMLLSAVYLVTLHQITSVYLDVKMPVGGNGNKTRIDKMYLHVHARIRWISIRCNLLSHYSWIVHGMIQC